MLRSRKGVQESAINLDRNDDEIFVGSQVGDSRNGQNGCKQSRSGSILIMRRLKLQTEIGAMKKIHEIQKSQNILRTY